MDVCASAEPGDYISAYQTESELWLYGGSCKHLGNDSGKVINLWWMFAFCSRSVCGRYSREGCDHVTHIPLVQGTLSRALQEVDFHLFDPIRVEKLCSQT